MNMRKITSLTALISFVLLMMTSIILYIVPSGRVAFWAGYKLYGVSKEGWGAVHINLGFLLLISIILHIYYNWTPMISYMKNRSKQLKIFTPDFSVSLVVTLVVFFGTLAGIPPMSSIIHLGEAITDEANLFYGEPPYGHAELSPLKDFTEKVKVDLDDSLTALKAAGIAITSADSTMKEIAEVNAVTPQQLFEIIKPKSKKEVGNDLLTMPEEAPGGTGKRTVIQICDMYQLDLQVIMAELKENGINVDAKQTMKEIAVANSVDPHAIYGAIYSITQK
jgi:Domain of unknown function (DUF4405)